VKPFALFIDYPVIQFIGRLSRKEQAQIWQRMLQIRDFPYNRSDYSEYDPFGRLIHIRVSAK
jgi:hypothetical protein